MVDKVLFDDFGNVLLDINGNPFFRNFPNIQQDIIFNIDVFNTNPIFQRENSNISNIFILSDNGTDGDARYILSTSYDIEENSANVYISGSGNTFALSGISFISSSNIGMHSDSDGRPFNGVEYTLYVTSSTGNVTTSSNRVELLQPINIETTIPSGSSFITNFSSGTIDRSVSTLTSWEHYNFHSTSMFVASASSITTIPITASLYNFNPYHITASQKSYNLFYYTQISGSNTTSQSLTNVTISATEIYSDGEFLSFYPSPLNTFTQSGDIFNTFVSGGAVIKQLVNNNVWDYGFQGGWPLKVNFKYILTIENNSTQSLDGRVWITLAKTGSNSNPNPTVGGISEFLSDSDGDGYSPNYPSGYPFFDTDDNDTFVGPNNPLPWP